MPVSFSISCRVVGYLHAARQKSETINGQTPNGLRMNSEYLICVHEAVLSKATRNQLARRTLPGAHHPNQVQGDALPPAEQAHCLRPREAKSLQPVPLPSALKTTCDPAQRSQSVTRSHRPETLRGRLFEKKRTHERSSTMSARHDDPGA